MSDAASNESGAAPDDVVVRVRDLHFSRGARPIFRGVDVDIRRGRVTAIMGPSGTGKTTLLRLIGGQIVPAAGSVKVEGHEVSRMSRDELYAMRKRTGVLFQSGALLTDMSVFDNVAFPIREHAGLPESMVRDLVLMKLEAVGLRAARDLMPRELSGGMARRAALARAIALDPMMVLYDEPFAGQDPISMGILVRLIRRLNDALGLTSVIVSHDINETCTIADYIYVVADGVIVGEGTPEVLAESSSEWVQQFMQGLPDGPVPFHFPGVSYLDDLMGSAP